MRLSHQVALASVSKTVKHISVFALSIILARTLSTENYGVYLQVQLVVSALLYLAIFGVPHSIYYFLPRSSQPRLLIGMSSLVLLIVATVLAVLVYSSAEMIAAKLHNPDLVGLASIMAALLFFQVPIKLFEPAMIAAKRVGTFVALNATFNLLFFFPVAVPALLGWPVEDILRAMLGFYIVQFLAMMGTLALTTRTLAARTEGEPYSFRAQVVYSFPIGLSGMVGEIGRQNDKIIVGGMFDPSQYALYTRGAMEIPLLNVISNSLHNLMMPRFVEAYRDGNTQELLRSWHSAIRLMAAFIYPACVFFIATGDLLIPFLYSDKFADASVIFQIYMLTLLVRVTTGDAVIRAIGRTGALLKLSVAAILINVTLTIALIKLMGITGAPTAAVVTSYLVMCAYIRIVAGMLGVPMVELFPWRSLGLILASSVVSIAAASVLRIFSLDRPAMLGAMFLTFACVYPLVFRLARVLDHRERDAVRSLMPPGLRWVA